MLTPQDIERKQFTSVRFKEGYDQVEVDNFMDLVCDEYTQVVRKLQSSEDRLNNQQTQNIVTVSGAERLLVVAEAAAEKCKEEAQVEADSIVTRAAAEASRIAEEAQEQARGIVAEGTAERHRQIGELEDQRSRLKEKVNELTRAEGEILSTLRKALDNWDIK